MKNFERPPFFPMMIDLQDKNVLIIGGGQVAARRAKTLLTCGARVKAISKNFYSKFPQVHEKITRGFEVEDITTNFVLVIAATNDREINRLIHDLAHEKNIPVNVADSKTECDFFFPSLIACDNVAVSVSSAGLSYKLTQKLSERLRNLWTLWVNELR